MLPQERVHSESVVCTPKVSQCPTSVMNEMAYEYISMDNILLV